MMVISTSIPNHTDRCCIPSLDINIDGISYKLSSFIEHRPLWNTMNNSADTGHYVAYVRLSEDGMVWKVANDDDEQVRTWCDIAGVHGYMFFYGEVGACSLSSCSVREHAGSTVTSPQSNLLENSTTETTVTTSTTKPCKYAKDGEFM